LREENDRLREIALSVEQVEQLKQENKLMRIEIQKIMVDGGGVGDNDEADEMGGGNVGEDNIEMEEL
jgi:hypothetical protein